MKSRRKKQWIFSKKPVKWALRRKIQKMQKKNKKVVDILKSVLYNNSCVTGKRCGDAGKWQLSGCGSAWLERLVWDQEVAGSNPVTPICAGVVQW